MPVIKFIFKLLILISHSATGCLLRDLKELKAMNVALMSDGSK